MNHSQRVLSRVAGADPPSESGLVPGHETRPVQGRAALQRAPAVEHGGGVHVRCLHAESLEVGVPVGTQGLEGERHFCRVPVAPDYRADVTGSVSDPQHIDDPVLRPGLQDDLMTERPNVVAAGSLASTRSSRDHGHRVLQSPVRSHEGLSIAVVAERAHGPRRRTGPSGENLVPATMALRSCVIAGAQYVLAPVEVVQVTGGVDEAQLHVAEDLDRLACLGAVGQMEYPQLHRAKVVGWSRRHEVQDLGPDAGFLGGDPCVARAMAALVAVQIRPHRLPGGAPVLTGVGSAEVDIATWLIRWERVVAIAAHPAVTRVAVEGEATGGVGDDASVTTLSQVVDPGCGRVRARDHVLAGTGVVVTVGVDGHGAGTGARAWVRGGSCLLNL